MSIRFALKGDHPRLKKLWMAAFLDSPEATDFYFTHRHQDENLLLDEEDGALQGMLTMLPIQLITGGKEKKARYFFAIATDEKYRARGVSTGLMQEAERLTREEGGAAALLVPANEPLFGFYGRRGYKTLFYYKRLSLRADELPIHDDIALLYTPDEKDMYRLRGLAHQKSRLFARWDEEALGYAARAAGVYGAALTAFKSGESEGYAYGEWDGDTLVVKDLALHGIAPMNAMAILHRELKAKQYILRLPEGETAGELVPYGMLKAFEPLECEGEAPYLSLGKD